MALPIEEVLSLWRELERTHDELPADAPDRQVIRLEIGRVRLLYRRLTERSEASTVLLTAAQRQMGYSRTALDAPGGASPGPNDRSDATDARAGDHVGRGAEHSTSPARQRSWRRAITGRLIDRPASPRSADPAGST